MAGLANQVSGGCIVGSVCVEETGLEALPEARLRAYADSGRNPRVLIKTL